MDHLSEFHPFSADSEAHRSFMGWNYWKDLNLRIARFQNCQTD